jgi:hypothetical protein
MTGVCVYWIRLPEHADVNNEGYVGVAADFDLRMADHYRETSRYDTHFARAIRLYGWKNLIKDIIFIGSDTQCYEHERTLRPRFQIGWNEAIGGSGGDRSAYIDYKSRAKPIGNRYPKAGKDNPFFNKKHSEEARKANSRSHAKQIIITPHGNFFGFSALGRYLGVHKATAKKTAIREGWQIDDKSEVFTIN